MVTSLDWGGLRFSSYIPLSVSPRTSGQKPLVWSSQTMLRGERGPCRQDDDEMELKQVCQVDRRNYSRETLYWFKKCREEMGKKVRELEGKTNGLSKKSSITRGGELQEERVEKWYVSNLKLNCLHLLKLPHLMVLMSLSVSLLEFELPVSVYESESENWSSLGWAPDDFPKELGVCESGS